MAVPGSRGKVPGGKPHIPFVMKDILTSCMHKKPLK